MLFGKPEKRSTSKARKKRKAAAVIQTVREQCVDRDGYCRLSGVARFAPCDGPSEWMHLGDHRRSNTRGMDPEERHRRDKSLMGCRRHHGLYDGRQLVNGQRLQIDEITDRGADGPLRFTLDGHVYEETR